ncbi:ATP-dependent sacrificial sulfur transferase LarE [Christensenellaceae bacterium OttesenSCG-928-K19]|nr:ATP-dependent sacrificial sulfur transferase LarE [Christensenellaceae bacterium OttesenSCG-928-K19]
MTSDGIQQKYEVLRGAIAGLGRVAVAFSGGVDSTLLLKVAHDVLGDDAVAVTARLHSHPVWEDEDAQAFTRGQGIRHISFDMDELQIKGFAENPANRCYLCKKAIMQKIVGIAGENDILHILEGSNTDDDGDFRPGTQAVRELGILTPLREAGLSKEEIRLLSKELGLPTWDKPSCACLSSRFAYGEGITREKLEMVEKAELLLRDMGFKQVRVRVHGELARIEIGREDMDRILDKELLGKIERELKRIGFLYATLDLAGYRTGSMNEVLRVKK